MRVLGARRLLNGRGFGSTAAIVAEVENTSRWKPGCGRDGKPLVSGQYEREPDVMWQVSDCSRAVVFEDHWTTAAGRRNTLRKVDAMIAVLQSFREGLVAEQARYVQRVRFAEKAKKDVCDRP